MNCLRYIGILSFISLSLSQSIEDEKVLFVGNSFTFYFNLPLVVESMAKEKGLNLDVYQSTAGGASLKHHWNGKKELSTRSMLDQQSFSKVILQDYSTNPVMKSKESMKYFKKFIDLLKSQDVEIYLYGTWPVPTMNGRKFPGIDPIQEALKPLESKKIRIVPVGTAFRLFQKEHPNISLFTSDNKHPSPVGVYLAACVFLKTLTGRSPDGLYRRFDRKDESGKKVFLGMVEKSDAKKCQAIVSKMEIK
tara:strand:- start:1755 stop:2501 length:747 start_codon:yes stop_codon:yes gene_type:complete